MREYGHGSSSTGGPPPPSFYAPNYEPSSFPTDNLAAMMKNNLLPFPPRVKVIKVRRGDTNTDRVGGNRQDERRSTTLS